MTHSRIAAAARTAAATVILAASSSAAWPGTTDALLAGSVASSASNSSPIVVVAIDRNKGKVAHRVFLTSKHEFRIPIVPGHYKLYAFVDTNGDGIRNAGEPVSVAYRLSGVMRAGEEITLPAFEIKH